MSGRRPAKRRQTNEAGSSQGFDQRRFISQEAENYHNERLLSRAMVRERGIQRVDDIAQRRHWEDFLNNPGVANKTLVREFYANLRFTDQQRPTVIVRGKNINFSARTINSLFDTPSIDTPGELQEFLEDHPPLDIICELICREIPQWTLSLTRERAIMIYAILTDVPFDIGHFLHRSILKSAMGGLTVGLYHPSLITKLCARAGLERQPGDELLQPDSMIHADHRPPKQAGAPVQPRQRQPPPAPRLEARVDRLADEVHQLQLQQQHHFSYQQQWWALWADQMNIPMSSRLHYPPNEPAEPSPNMGDD
ncbi:hypothetical protein CDL12_14821 [Handroanthus impetiginosus]|uniref:Putative plant transposon protein domain-containing protein n=1 Tax=Handroanthus impetiginosus TaxID=429701 RepID=A0A2G9H4X8_9LAMI|nr:hypothetical protein CDL12_14821 [Handroanthus impetiginosus]